MAEHDEFTIAYEEEGRELVRELKREVLTTGAWATVMFQYQDRSRNNDEWSEPKVRIQRYQKRGGVYKPQSKFNISSGRQAQQIVDVLRQWYELEKP